MKMAMLLGSKWAAGWLTLFACLCAAGRASAHMPFPSLSDNGVVVGPSLAYAPGDGQRSGFLFGADATFTAGFAWVSLGARARPGERWNAYPYGEAGIWLLVNFGVGYSFGVGPDVPKKNWHWFVGVPIPVSALSDDGAFFIEPYYRPTMAIDDPAPTLHELGLLVKWAFPADLAE
jgi:hypothetical protein